MSWILWPIAYREEAGLTTWLGRGLHWTATCLAVLIGGVGITTTSVILKSDEATYQSLSDGIVPTAVIGFAIAGVVYLVGRLLRRWLSHE
jgi:hypothetical protein